MADKKKSKSPQSRRGRAPARSAQIPTAAAQAPVCAQPHHAPRVFFTAPIAVRWRDLDAFNHVNNSSYFTFLEEARLQWLRTIKGEWFNEHAMPVIAAIEMNYRAPIAWPAAIKVELSCNRIGTSSLTVGHRIIDAADTRKLYCDGHAVLVWTDPATGQSVPLPQAIRNACA
ncbi:MAG: acyl-CoA thioesterase [Rhodanobacteraceae bacterium]